MQFVEISNLYLKEGTINIHLINHIRSSLSDTKSACGVLSTLFRVFYKASKARGAYMDSKTSGPF